MMCLILYVGIIYIVTNFICYYCIPIQYIIYMILFYYVIYIVY